MTHKHRFKVDKLIRDKLPEIMRAQGIAVFERVMEKEEYIQRLKDKLIEETQEVLDAKTTTELGGELADVLEVLKALCAANNITFEEVIQIQEQKKKERGGFDGRIYNAFVEIDSNNKAIDYYLARPEHYPEINDDRE